MPAKIITFLFILLLFTKANAEEKKTTVESHNRHRVVVEAGQELHYKVEGHNLVPMTDSIRISDDYFGFDVTPQLKTTEESYDRRGLSGNQVAGAEVKVKYLNDILPVGLGFVFLHPSYVPLEGKGLPYDFNLRSPQGMRKIPTFDVVSKITEQGWSHELTLNKTAPEEPFQPLSASTYRRKLLDLTVKIEVNFDKEKQRVTEAHCEYVWSLDRLDDPLPVDLGSQNKKKIKEHRYKVKITLLKNTLFNSSSYTARVTRAVEMSKSHLLAHVRDTLDPYKASYKIKQDRLWQVGVTSLAMFALFKSGLDPSNDDVKELIDHYIHMLAAHGYTKDRFLETKRPAYDCSVILMTIAAIMNPQESKKKKKKYTFSKVSPRHKRILLELAERCMKAISSGDGHVWDYKGKRHQYYPGGYSRAQYTVLGLRSAMLLNLKVPQNVWNDILQYTTRDFTKHKPSPLSKGSSYTELKMTFVDGLFDKRSHYRIPSVTDVGGWYYTYMPQKKTKKKKKQLRLKACTFNMTCSGLGNLAMAYEYAKSKKYKKKSTRQAMVNGLVWIQSQLDTLLDETKGINYYAYYSYERVAVFYGIDKVNGFDWHQRMSDKLIQHQMATGQFMASGTSGFCDSPGNICTSAYALLFLKKATRPLKKYTVSTQ